MKDEIKKTNRQIKRLTLNTKEWEVIGTLGLSLSLYVAIAPQTAMRPKGFIWLITVDASSPPTLSKKQSTPLGAPSFNASSAFVFRYKLKNNNLQ